MPAFAVGWRQIGVCFMLLAASGMIASTYSLVAVPLAREYHPSRMVLALSMTVLSGACAVLAPLLGNLLDRFSVRKLMMLGGLCLAAGFGAISLTTSFTQVLIIYGVLIAPANILLGPVAITVLLSRWFIERRGMAIGIAIAGISTGGFFFPMIIQGLLDAHAWREALRWLALVLVFWTLPIAMLVVDRPADRGLNPDGASTAQAAARAAASKPALSVRAILTDPAFWMIAATVAIVTSGMKGMITNLAPLALDSGIDPTIAASFISIYSACGFISKITFAAVADRTGPRVPMYMSLIGLAVGMACLTQAHAGYAVIALGVGIIGMFGGMMIPTESYLAPRVFGEAGVGRAIGLLSGTILLALLATPPLFGLIFDLTGSYNGIFWTFTALGLIALLWAPAIRLHPREQRGSSAPVAAE